MRVPSGRLQTIGLFVILIAGCTTLWLSPTLLTAGVFATVTWVYGVSLNLLESVGNDSE